MRMRVREKALVLERVQLRRRCRRVKKRAWVGGAGAARRNEITRLLLRVVVR